jgi:SAM-dependent methyltransferase
MASDQLWNANIQYHSLLVKAIPHGARHVLDVGCGDGILSARLARAGVPHVVGLDLDRDVLERARTRHLGVAVEWQQGDIFDVPFEAGSFDAVVSVATLHHLNAEAGLVRFANLLRHGAWWRSWDLQPTIGGTSLTPWPTTVLGSFWVSCAGTGNTPRRCCGRLERPFEK